MMILQQNSITRRPVQNISLSTTSCLNNLYNTMSALNHIIYNHKDNTISNTFILLEPTVRVSPPCARVSKRTTGHNNRNRETN